MEAHVFMPADVPKPFINECRVLGAKVTLIDGLITDCGKAAREGVEKHGRFDVSTLKEPYRIEGKKTMGYEVAEQMDWQLPDVIVYPTGGGTGLVGMWKAFDEMEKLGWIGPKRPRMVTVQSTGCAPMVKAFQEGKEFAEPWPNAKTIADGMRVPAAVGDFLILRALRESRGTAVAVPDSEILEATYLMGKTTGIWPAPEGGATLAALLRLRKDGWVHDGESVVLFNTGSGAKYSHIWD
jgi:threonine synthase